MDELKELQLYLSQLEKENFRLKNSIKALRNNNKYMLQYRSSFRNKGDPSTGSSGYDLVSRIFVITLKRSFSMKLLFIVMFLVLLLWSHPVW